jgi:RNA polymerase sigma-70 factor (ECF subfamily)
MAEPGEWTPTDYAAKLIKWKAKQLVGKYGFTDADREDIEQQLLLHLWRRWSGYNSNRHPDAFAKVVVRNAVASLVERQRAIKRGGGRRQLSLNDPVGEEEERTIEHGDLVDQDSALRRLGRTQRPFTDEADLRLALKEVRDSLPPEAQELVDLLAKYNPTEISQATGIPRGTLLDRITKLRKPLSEAGLEEFLPRSRRAADEPGT